MRVRYRTLFGWSPFVVCTACVLVTSICAGIGFLSPTWLPEHIHEILPFVVAGTMVVTIVAFGAIRTRIECPNCRAWYVRKCTACTDRMILAPLPETMTDRERVEELERYRNPDPYPEDLLRARIKRLTGRSKVSLKDCRDPQAFERLKIDAYELLASARGIGR